MKTNVFSYDDLLSFSRHIFLKMGSSEAEAALAAQVLVQADLRGVDSHGVARLSGYARLWKAGRINAKPNIQTVHETPSTAVVDGDGGLGLVVTPHAMDMAITKATQCGTGWVAIRNSNHFGIAAYHTMKALEHDMIGMAMTNASPLVAPTFSTEQLLGTNPICVAIPAGNEPPFVADFATTPAANGKLEILQREGKEAPDGWLQTAEGRPSTDPAELKKGGAFLPLGSDREHGSHKGFCLGAWVDIFSGVLSGANYGPWVPPFVSFLAPADNPVGKGIGHFVGAMRVDAFRPTDVFKKHMDTWIERFRSAKAMAGTDGVVIPGDPERAYEKERMAKGIVLNQKVYDDLMELSDKFNVPLSR